MFTENCVAWFHYEKVKSNKFCRYANIRISSWEPSDKATLCFWSLTPSTIIVYSVANMYFSHHVKLPVMNKSYSRGRERKDMNLSFSPCLAFILFCKEILFLKTKLLEAWIRKVSSKMWTQSMQKYFSTKWCHLGRLIKYFYLIFCKHLTWFCGDHRWIRK